MTEDNNIHTDIVQNFLKSVLYKNFEMSRASVVY